MVVASRTWRSGQLHLGQVGQVAGLALRVAALLLRVEEVAQGVLLRRVGGLENALCRTPRHRLRTLHLKVETVLLNLLLWPLVEMNRCVCLVGREAGVWDHQRWGENGRRGWRSDSATGNWLHLYWGRQDLLLCNEFSLLPAGAALRGLAAAVGGGHHGLEGLIQQHPEAPVLAVVRLRLPFAAVSRHLCSHCNGMRLRKHHGVVVEGH